MHSKHNLPPDLNLLVPLLALLEERHVTRAANRAGIGQPAMSRILERARTLLGDELLVRRGSGYERTARGDELCGALREALDRVETAVSGAAFDPAKTRERFGIVTTDYAANLFLPAVTASIARLAPNARLEVALWGPSALSGIRDGTYDLGLIGLDQTGDLASEPLFEDRFVCLVADGHPLHRGPLSVEDYARFPHVAVGVDGGRQSWIDRPLRTLGYERRVILTTTTMLSAALAVQGTDAMFTLSRRWYERFAPLVGGRILEPPPVFEAFRYGMAWHPRETGEAARWLRSLVRSACSAPPFDEALLAAT